MHNNPFARPSTYSTIKRNRIIRSQKKFTQASSRDHRDAKEHFKTQMQALINSTPGEQSAFISCIDQLKQRLLQRKHSPNRKATLEGCFVLQRKNSQNKHKQRSKTNGDRPNYQFISKSMNLVPQKNIVSPSLMDLQAMRNQVKRQKHLSCEKRIPTDNQRFRYQEFSQEKDRGVYFGRSQSRKFKRSSEVRLRSNTEQVIHSAKYPSRSYHHSHSSPKKITFDQPELRTFLNYKKNPKNVEICNDNNLIKQPPMEDKEAIPEIRLLQPVIDNNEKIGDLSTIAKEKETLNFLGQSCVGIKQELSPKRIPNSSKLLEFVDWRTNQLKNAFSGGKQKKRKNGFEKLSKIFPKGFFI